ncbi:MAG: hypothetical protein Q8R92_09720 [Deltaproteobacteria bacterium]|nr:hypothetical protein [Deltaproteobacteria bacterium]
MYIIGIKADAAASTTAEFTPGTVGANYDGGFKVYKYMMYDEGTAAVDGVAGEVAYYVADTGYGANTVTSDLSDSDEVGAGVLQVNMSDNEYGWFQIKGFATLSIALTAATDGAPQTPTGSGDGSLDDTTAATDAVCAITIDASAKEIICDFPY